MARTVVLEQHVIDYTTGHWCPWCALPSVIRATILWVDAATLRIVKRSPVAVCEECVQLLDATSDELG